MGINFPSQVPVFLESSRYTRAIYKTYLSARYHLFESFYLVLRLSLSILFKIESRKIFIRRRYFSSFLICLIDKSVLFKIKTRVKFLVLLLLPLFLLSLVTFLNRNRRPFILTTLLLSLLRYFFKS